jgi:hypothetical protein
MAFAPVDLTPNISFSQIHSLEACSWQWALEKVYRVPTRHSWPLAGGKAYHQATERYDYAREGLPLPYSITPEMWTWAQLLEIDCRSGIQTHSSEWLFERANEAAQYAAFFAEQTLVDPGMGVVLDAPSEQPAWPLINLDLGTQVGILKAAYTELIESGESSQDTVAWATDLRDIVGNKAIREEKEALLRAEHQNELEGYEAALALEPDNIRDLWIASFLHEVFTDYGQQVKKWENGDPALRGDRPDPETWKASGRASEAWPDKENFDWWKLFGVTMLKSYVDWREETNLRLAYLDGKPCIELNVTHEVAGAEVRAHIDRIFIHPNDDLIVTDIKTGHEPKNKEQLGLYSSLVEIRGLPRPKWGIFWLAKACLKKPVKAPYYTMHDLDLYDLDFFEWKYGGIKRQRDDGFFYANTQFQYCQGCEVQDYCYAVEGDKADQVPKPWKAERPKIRIPIEPVAPIQEAQV